MKAVRKHINLFLEKWHAFLCDQIRNDTVSKENDAENIFKNQYVYWNSRGAYPDRDITPIPARPSQGDIEIYKNYLKNFESEEKKILLLGATPELRDLLASNSDNKIYLADFTYTMPITMLRYATRVDPYREIWIKANWLDLPFSENFFDIIIGDLVLQQFLPEDESIFFKKMKVILKENGILCSRFQFLKENKETIESIVQETMNALCPFWQKVHLLRQRLLWHYADFASRRFRRRYALEELEKYIISRGYRADLENDLLFYTKEELAKELYSYRSWCPPTENILLEKIESAFSLLERRNAADYKEASQFPIFLLSPKK